MACPWDLAGRFVVSRISWHTPLFETTTTRRDAAPEAQNTFGHVALNGSRHRSSPVTGRLYGVSRSNSRTVASAPLVQAATMRAPSVFTSVMGVGLCGELDLVLASGTGGRGCGAVESRLMPISPPS